MFTTIKVNFKPPRHAQEVLELIRSQNKEVELEINEDDSITLSAEMLDFTTGQLDD